AMRSLRRLAVLLLLLALAGAAYWQLRLRPLAVAVAAVEHDVPVRVFGLGTVEAQVVSRVGFEVAGTLTRVLADHGDQVVAGSPMAHLDTAAAEARVAKAEAAAEAAAAAVTRAEAQAERAEALLAMRRSTAQRRRELAPRGAVSAEQVEQAETDATVAAADLAVVRADLAVLAAARADAQAVLRAERTQLAKHTLGAPFDALVVARNFEPGTALAPGQAVFTLVAPGSFWALAYIDEARAGDLAPGQPATVRLRSRPQSLVAAEVVRIGLEADRVNEERRVWVRCKACPGQLVLGEQAEVTIETGRLASARLVPEAAVRGYDGMAGLVWVVEGGQLRQRGVRFVARTLDARLAIEPASLPPDLAVVTEIGAGFAPGRAAYVRQP
ncbi:MAG: efflux RND transporter periplasmic adaptor subunit, partial [Acetobacteraceae bacterium]|nr:efflux RND transporter periplasmic adaptor subunit [Acetobacteraceae bacterium]